MIIQKPSERKHKELPLELLHINPKYKQTVWDEIMHESEENNAELEEYKKMQNPIEEVPLTPPMEYMETKLLNLLHKGVEEMLTKAIQTDSLIRYHSTFNGLDYLAEFLWNQNPLHPKRAQKPHFIFDMTWVKIFLNKYPRDFFPLSWIYTDEIAAIIIQRSYRAYLVRKRDDVQEMRQFWKIMRGEAEDQHPKRYRGRSVQLEATKEKDASRMKVFKSSMILR